MTSAFPAGLDSIAADKTNGAYSEGDHPAHHNLLADAVNAIEESIHGLVFLVAADGSAQYSSIQAAVDAAATAGGGLIRVKPGTYAPASLVGVSNIRIEGDGPATIIRIPNASTANALLIRNSTRISVANLLIDGNSANVDTGGNQYETINGVFLDKAVECVVENIWAHDVYYSAVQIEGRLTGASSDIVVRNCRFWDNRDNPIFVRPGVQRVQIEGNNCSGTRYYGIGAVDADYLVIRGNICRQNGVPSLANGEGGGIAIGGCGHVVISGNILISNDPFGIKTEFTKETGPGNPPRRSRDVTITGNTFSGHGSAGMSAIGVLNSDYVRVTANIAAGAYYGITVGGSQDPDWCDLTGYSTYVVSSDNTWDASVAADTNVSPVESATNLLSSNPQFASNAAGWGATLGAISRTTAQYYFGNASGAVAFDNTPSSTYYRAVSPTGTLSGGSTSGREIACSGYVRGTGSSVGLRVRLWGHAFGGASPQMDILDTVTLTADWQRLEGLMTISASDQTSVQLFFQRELDNPVDDELFYVDGAMAAEAVGATELYCDTSRVVAGIDVA